MTYDDLDYDPGPPPFYREDPVDYDRLHKALANGATYDAALIEQGFCPDIVAIETEDGPSDGRCFAPITDPELGACEGHAAERRQWMAMSEVEKARWERQHDEEHP